MKIQRVFALVLLLSATNITFAAIYKCEDANENVSFQSQPCDELETSLVIESLATNTIGKSEKQSVPKTVPFGSWVNKNKSTLRARISKSGSFELSGEGDRLSGRWKEQSKSSYEVKAKFRGKELTFTMEYEISTDTLVLNIPGTSNSLRRYVRK